MKILTIICILLAFCVFASCDDDPVEPKKNPPPNYSGTFLMADTLISSTCQIPVAPGATENVTVRNDTIIFAGLTGSWDAANLRGHGTDGPYYVPIPPNCTANYTVTFDITYLDEDHFYGTWHVLYDYPTPCSPSYQCTYTYNIGGTRP